MASTFLGVEIARKGVQAHQKALQVTGQNIANADNKAYSRQAVHLGSYHPLMEPSLSRSQTPGHLGTGVTVERIQRIRNDYLDMKVRNTASGKGYHETVYRHMRQVEKIYNEPGEEGLSVRYGHLRASFQKLSNGNNGFREGKREEVVQKAKTFTHDIRDTFGQLIQIRRILNDTVNVKVNRVNNLAKDIAELNDRIIQAKAAGDDPNGLMDRRDALIEDMAGEIGISVSKRDEDELLEIHIGGRRLVQGKVARQLEVFPDGQNNNLYGIRWREDGQTLQLAAEDGGALKGVLDMRDGHLRKELHRINTLAANVIDMYNEVHRDGFGLDGVGNRRLFKKLTLADTIQADFGDYDPDSDGTDTHTALFKVTGTVDLRTPNTNETSTQALGVEGTLTFDSLTTPGERVTVDYSASDNIGDIMKRINAADAQVTAYVNHNGRLALKARGTADPAQKSFVIRHIEDSGTLLTQTTGLLRANGAAGAYEWTQTGQVNQLAAPARLHSQTPELNPAAWIALDDAVAANPEMVAAQGGVDSDGDGVIDQAKPSGDNSAALALSHIDDRPVVLDETRVSGRPFTITDYMADIVQDTGARAEMERVNLKSKETQLENFTAERDAYSGVALDEEFSNLIKYQHGYTASAKVVAVMDNMLDTIINRMGR